MSRALSFPGDAVGQVYVMVEGTQPEQQAAQGTIDVPEGAKAYLLLDESADPALPFLEGVESDVVAVLQAKAVDAAGVARLAKQTAVQQASVGKADDAALAALAGGSLQMLEATLVGEAGAGVAALTGLTKLHLHGDPGEELGALARSSSLTELHFHAASLGLDHLRSLATSTHLESLDVEVESVLDDGDADVVDALVAVASGLKSLRITLADGATGLSSATMTAVLRSCADLALNGTTYTAAAVERMARKAALV